MAGVNTDDLTERLQALKLPGVDGLSSKELEKGNGAQFRRVCASLAEGLAPTSTAAKVAAKQLHGAQQDPAALDAALAQLHEAVCGPSNGRLDRLELLERLIAHLQATRLLQLGSKAPAQAAGVGSAAGGRATEASESLRDLAKLVGAAPCSTAAQQLAAVESRLQALATELPPGFFDEPLVPKGSLSSEQAAVLEQVHAVLQHEYGLRRRMLAERARVTLQALLWGQAALKERGTQQAAAAAAQRGGEALREAPAVRLEDVYSACMADVMAAANPRSHSSRATAAASVKSVLIGSVPDRGGRPEEGRAAAAAAAMPAWAPRSAAKHAGGGGRGGGGGRSGASGGAGRGGGGRHGSGRVQGGWHGGKHGRGRGHG